MMVTATRTDLLKQLGTAGCELPEPGSPAEAKATRLWNAALHCRPALVARCGTAVQVGAAFRLAREAGMPVCIHNGGQDWNGRSLHDGALALDISGMDSISIDSRRREAVIGGGVTSGSLVQSAAEQELAAVIGSDGAVSMVGLMLGGGYGPLMTRFGLACDNLLAVEAVTPDGRVVTCDAHQHPELFWALRGGGGGFAVVTSARVRLHAPGPQLHAGTIVFPWPDAQAALVRYGEIMLHAPAELFGSAVLAIGPGGRPAVVVSLVWTGGEAQGRDWVGQVASAGILASTNGKLAQGLGYEVATRWLEALTSDAAQALVVAFEGCASPISTVILHHCHGAAIEVPSDATAFGMRRPHFTALIYGAWEPSGEDTTARSWARGTAAALDPFALPGAYANLLADNDGRIGEAFGVNAARLAEIKRQMDPAGTLCSLPLPTD